MRELPAVYMSAETSRKEKSMKKMAINFQEQRVDMSDFNLGMDALFND